jgi:hypothetical protein
VGRELNARASIGSRSGPCERTSASSRTIATWVIILITSEERDRKETLALTKMP